MSKQSSQFQVTTVGQKITALGLASATCIGLVGVIAVRNVQEASATESTGQSVPVDSSNSTGVTQAQLDIYAAALAAERQRLDAYRLQLVAAANALNGRSGVVSTIPAGPKKSRAPQAIPTAPKAPSIAKGSVVNAPAPAAPPAVQAPVVQAPAPAAPPAVQAPMVQAPAPAAPAPNAGKTRASKG
ncbi:MAG: hypothetical protein Q8L05_07200 [Actinomycetota bacterium]|nr:hypothetical protein [Actinomycetota bacterium]MDP2287499.1 hypothetical protein [Actinomycetota bacterium]